MRINKDFVWIIGLPILIIVLMGLLALTSAPPTLGAYLIQEGRVENVVINPIHDPLAWMWDNSERHLPLEALDFPCEKNDSCPVTQGPREWLGCLQGEMHGDTLWIVGIELGMMKASSSYSVQGVCRPSPTYIGTVHPHYPLPDGSQVRTASLRDLTASCQKPSDAVIMVQMKRDSVWVGTRFRVGDIPPVC